MKILHDFDNINNIQENNNIQLMFLALASLKQSQIFLFCPQEKT